MKKVLVTFVVALFATVVFGQTKTEMGPNEVPDCVTKYITANMPGYNIDKAVQIENLKVVTYEVTISKAKQTQVLIFSADCKVVKKAVPDKKKNPDDGTEKKKKPEPRPKPVPPAPKPQTTPAKPAVIPPKK